MLRFILSFFGGIFTFLTMAALMAAVSIGAVLWVYGRDLPSHEALAQYRPKVISRIYSNEGRIIDEFAQERRLYTPPDEIPALVKQAFISAEDKNFYIHKGYDLRGMAAAAIDYAKGGRLRGASTITQQVMKNFLLDGGRNFERKIREIILATRIEETLSKDEILALYLNEIDLGARSFGVAAAAQTYFNKTLRELAPEEAAFLAIHPKAPYSYHPVKNHDAAVQRRDFVLREMKENGYLTQEQYETARAAPLRSVQNGDYDSFKSALPPRDFFSDEIRRQLSRDFGEEEFFNEGYSVRATIDPEMQLVAARALRAQLEEYDRGLGQWRKSATTIPADRLKTEEDWRAALAELELARDIDVQGRWFPAVVLGVEDQQLRLGIEEVQETEAEPFVVPRKDISWIKGDFKANFDIGDVVYVRRMTEGQNGEGAFIRWTLRQIPEIEGAFMAMDVNTGRVIAMQGGFSYQNSVFNRATQALRQPGSNFKPFVYAAALDSGYSPATIVIDAPIEINTPQGVWRPKNASNEYYGPTPLRTGIEQSRNLMTIRLAEEVGMDVVGAYAERFGVYDHMQPVLANALGSQETTLFKIVSAYAMFANGGERVEPTLVDRVQDRWGRTIYRHDKRECPDCLDPTIGSRSSPRIVTNRERVMDAVTAYQLTSMMEGVVTRGTARGAIDVGVPVAGKTGTTNDAKDVWFTGFTSNIVAGCYMGYDRPQPLGRGAFGASMCAPVWNDFMKVAVKKYGGGKFRVPPACQFIKIDRFTGARLDSGASGANVVSECFREGEEPLFGVMFDGGFAMGSDFTIIAPGADQGKELTTVTGKKAVVGPKASFGSLSSGGLY